MRVSTLYRRSCQLGRHSARYRCRLRPHSQLSSSVRSPLSITLQAAVELEREAATKLAYFLNLLRRHLLTGERYSADTCRYVTVSTLGAIHVVCHAAICLFVAATDVVKTLSDAIICVMQNLSCACRAGPACPLVDDGCLSECRRWSKEDMPFFRPEAIVKAAHSTRSCRSWSFISSR